MDHPELVTVADRRVMIGVLANLAAAFLGAVDHPRAAGSLTRNMTARFRNDLGRDLGRTPTDQECYEAVEAQIDRLRRSIGEYD
ncbi:MULTISPECIES: hypothetical protein [Curtobacterium]|jgi:hypothetical protein|uniref:hypothetical protein n=1 Tax=Curtobacterium TaxID=2034 RepID=UPI000DAAB6EF|nr:MULTISPECIES: hypothetical protein [Curtobacterium]MCS5521426.1 hypothetical protein [Curtobacterium flaccumfaciens pv. oortii]WIE58010.1 hypothetical protein DEI96_017940 [Curtobacterium sp. MCLR17_031]